MKLYTDSLHKIAYATDASVYREIPYGVAYPETIEDVQELMRMARERHTHLIPRAGGTSIAGQVVGSGIVVDISKHWNHILEINQGEQWARVEPGVVRDELNIALKPYGLFFSPETSTSNRCCIGGMFGNNSCGTHSLVYGSTRHHVLEAKAVLADGSIEEIKNYRIGELESRFGDDFWKKKKYETLTESIYAQLISFALQQDIVGLIKSNFPDKDLRRRSCGYAIDEVIEDLTDNDAPVEERTINLCKLLAGSEGTLAFITEIKVSLDVLPPKEIMVVCGHCDNLDKSFEANLVALKHHPTAIELMDGDILELSKGNAEQQKNRFFVEGNPAALLITELRAETRDELDAQAEALEKDLLNSGLVYLNTRVYGADVAKVWALRKAGLGILGGMKGDAKPMGVIEDTAVAPKFMPAYMKDFQKMTKRLGANVVYYGHISTGELHLRPIINLKTKEGQKLFRDLATETAILVKKHRGSISGEHGDGRLRGEFIKMLYGEETYQLMREVKQCWDPNGMFNLHKIVDTLPMDSMLRFDIDQQYDIEKKIGSDNTYFNWKAAFDECTAPGATGAKNQVNALMCSIEQCNGAGDCRKSNIIGGTLCPAYKVSGDELKTTRARANVLREILTRGGDAALVKEELDSCLACKGCKSECPSNVDMTRLRAEVLQHYYDRHGTPLRSLMVARMAQIEQLGFIVRPLYNFFASWSLSSYLIKKVISFSSKRQIPTLSRYSMRQSVKKEQANYRISKSKKKVYLFADEFTNLQEAELGLTFAKLLMRLGYKVDIPNHVESGRAAISKGCLKYAKKFAEKNVALLADKISDTHPLIGIEPSCILSFRDEYPDLVAPENRNKATALAKNSLLYDEFLLKEIESGNISAEEFSQAAIEIWLHGHCHQKALVGVDKTARVLQQLLAGAKVNVIPSGCCGMAGSFGYEKEHYETSLAIGEMLLFPAVRKAMAANYITPAIVAAPGISCRQQILDGTGIKAVHPIEILYKFLKDIIVTN
jgi:FAD/FMN-containing dehydrogenase/NAD-dependent dihydropyrimidine dehydrogenase PreA subunit